MTTAPHRIQLSTSTDGQVMSRPGQDAPTETDAFILEMLERLDAADVKAEHLELALIHSRDIGAAIGILMCQNKIRQPAAFALLSRSSQHQNRKLYDVARDVLDTGELACAGE